MTREQAKKEKLVVERTTLFLKRLHLIFQDNLVIFLLAVAEVDTEFLEDQKGPRKIRRSEHLVADPILESNASTSTSPPEEQHSGPLQRIICYSHHLEHFNWPLKLF